MYLQHSRRKLSIVACALAVVLGPGVVAQDRPAAPAPSPDQTPQRDPSGQVFRSGIDLVTTDVIVRDRRGQFVPDLAKDEFEVLEDGVPQKIVSFVLTHGGRVTNLAAPPPAPIQEGIILPPSRPTSDSSGRIFMIFVDDLHLDFRNTGRIRELFRKMEKELIHEGDMFGIVSTGPSSLAIDMTYDRKRLDQAIDRISGSGLSPKEILETPEGAQGVAEVRYRAHVAFSTAYDIIDKLEQVHNRRKAFIYVSNGYDFDPFSDTRKKQNEEKAREMGLTSDGSDDGSGNTTSPRYEDSNPFYQKSNEFADADLASELGYLTRAANRANVTFYTIDPRGLVGGPDIDQEVDMMDYQRYVTQSQNSLRSLAELTGGFAVVNQNDFSKGLKRIDNETSDYYVIGYYSTNPDPLRKRRRLDVKVTRPDLDVQHRTEYTIKTPKPVDAGK
jgi:VWFA-related protein